MYQALYRAERPESFDEILGQEHIVKILKHQIATDTVSHAYVFCGTRGTGKTTTARILAKAVNCLEPNVNARPCCTCANCKAIQAGSFMDVIEVDAASNNGVDNIRELRESVNYLPVQGRKKVYIIDEVHMLSPGAANAILKTLEEPPENVMFILATTEPQKLLQTILSRCMRLDFKRVPQDLLISGMDRICKEKGVNMTEGALKLLANAADGSVRDGLSILDQVLASGEKEIDRDMVLSYIGSVGDEFFIELTHYVSVKKVPEALLLIDKALGEGKDAKQILKDWNSHYRNLLVTKFVKSPEDMINMSSENIVKVKEQSSYISLEEIDQAITKLSKTINDARWSTQPRILLELVCVSLATGMVDTEKLAAKPKTAPSVAPVKARPASVEAPAPAKNAEPKVEMPVPQPEDEIAFEDDPIGRLFDDVPKAPVTEEAVPKYEMTEDTSCDKDMLWREILEAGEDGTGSFNLVRAGARLARVDSGTFLVIAKNAFTKNYVETKKTIIEKTATNVLGRRMRMLVEVEKTQDAEALSPKDMAKSASEMLGIKVTVD